LDGCEALCIADTSCQAMEFLESKEKCKLYYERVKQVCCHYSMNL
jgi:hypothetical protein